MEDDDKVELEALIDKYTLAEVIEALAYIATEKEEHVQTNWQDTELARAWRKAGEILSKNHEQVDTLEV